MVQKGQQKRKRKRAKEENRVTFKITEAEPLPENLLEYVLELAEVSLADTPGNLVILTCSCVN